MKNTLIILDAGHGGVINNVYQTTGKRSPIWSDGTQLFEGVFNRNIVNGIAAELKRLGIPHKILVPEQQDIPLSTRVRRANNIARTNPDLKCLLISVHANAGGGTGFEVFTYYGQSESDSLAECIAESFKGEFPTEKLRADLSDNDSDKEANYYLLRKTIMPAVLTENFFMDSERDCKEIQMTPQGQSKIINYHVKAIQEYVSNESS